MPQVLTLESDTPCHSTERARVLRRMCSAPPSTKQDGIDLDDTVTTNMKPHSGNSMPALLTKQPAPENLPLRGRRKRKFSTAHSLHTRALRPLSFLSDTVFT